MAEFIIGGPGFLPRMVEAATQPLARRQAIILAFRVGKVEGELRACWAEPWTFNRAYDLGLIPAHTPPLGGEGSPPREREGAEEYWQRVFRTPSPRLRQAMAEEANIKMSMRHTRPW